MEKKYIVLYLILLISFFGGINLKAQSVSLDSLSAERLPSYGDTLNSCISVYFKIVNIDSLDEINIDIIKNTGDTIFIVGKVLEKHLGGYKVLITNTLQFLSYSKGSFQKINIYLPKTEADKISDVFFDVKRKGVTKNKNKFKIKNIKL